MLLTKPTINRANFLLGNRNYVACRRFYNYKNRRSVAKQTIWGRPYVAVAIDIRYPHTVTVMLRKDHPWQYRQSLGRLSIARGDVYIIIAGLGGGGGGGHVVISSQGTLHLGGPIIAGQYIPPLQDSIYHQCKHLPRGPHTAFSMVC